MTSPASQALSILSLIKHPLEGIAYLFYLALLVRWRWPKTWNGFLEKCKAHDELEPM